MKSTDEGILLHRLSYSETSVITTFLTKNGGIKKFLFKGGKKKSAQLFPLSISELTYYGRQDSELLSLTKLESIQNQTFQFSPLRSSVAYFIAELLLKCVKNEEKDENLYDYVSSTAGKLSNAESVSNLPVEVLLDLIVLLGIKPLVSEIGDTFNLTSGTIGAPIANEHIQSNGSHIAYIRSKLEDPEVHLQIDGQQRELITELLIDYLKIHIGGFRGLDSYEIVKEVVRS